MCAGILAVETDVVNIVGAAGTMDVRDCEATGAADAGGEVVGWPGVAPGEDAVPNVLM